MRINISFCSPEKKACGKKKRDISVKPGKSIRKILRQILITQLQMLRQASKMKTIPQHPQQPAAFETDLDDSASNVEASASKNEDNFSAFSTEPPPVRDDCILAQITADEDRKKMFLLRRNS